MAVFTEVTPSQLSGLLASYFRQYEVSRFEGITAGIENSNFFLDVSLPSGLSYWVLTIFEMSGAEELPPVIRLIQHLASKGLPVPAPVNTLQEKAVVFLDGKPAVLVPRIEGNHLSDPGVEECHQIGRFLASMHQAAENLPVSRPSLRNLSWLEASQKQLTALAKDDQDLLDEEIAWASGHSSILNACPAGWIHGDLFIDNALFSDRRLTGVIDFYHACCDRWIIDLAVMCNDWCYRLGEGYHKSLMASLIAGYEEVRPLTEKEKICWPDALRLGALRFWVSRLLSLHTETYQKEAKRGQVFKNPDEKKEKLIAARSEDPI